VVEDNAAAGLIQGTRNLAYNKQQNQQRREEILQKRIQQYNSCVYLYQSISQKENPAAFFFSSLANQSVRHFNIYSCLIRNRRSERKIRHYWKHTTT
jgi:hypothetical protein